jgi:hypothetical protein
VILQCTVLRICQLGLSFRFQKCYGAKIGQLLVPEACQSSLRSLDAAVKGTSRTQQQLSETRSVLQGVREVPYFRLYASVMG